MEKNPYKPFKLNKINVARYNIRLFLSLLAQGIIFFTASGTLEIPRAWLFFTITIFYYFIGTIILLKTTPELVNQRGGSAFKDTTAKWDKIILLAYTILGLYAQFFVAGWDLGRIEWWPLGTESLIVGLLLYLISIILILWAMIKNPFFEPSARIQNERGQRVIKTGPYRIVRHPGYLSGVLWHIAMPLIIGSSLALIFSICIILLLVVRTHLEDRFLTDELTGYANYREEVKYRIFPGIW